MVSLFKLLTSLAAVAGRTCLSLIQKQYAGRKVTQHWGTLYQMLCLVLLAI